jgi:transposase-like protein
VKENGRTTYRISEAARELGISAEWLRVGRSESTEESVRESTEVSGGDYDRTETVGE